MIKLFEFQRFTKFITFLFIDLREHRPLIKNTLLFNFLIISCNLPLMQPLVLLSSNNGLLNVISFLQVSFPECSICAGIICLEKIDRQSWLQTLAVLVLQPSVWEVEHCVQVKSQFLLQPSIDLTKVLNDCVLPLPRIEFYLTMLWQHCNYCR